MAAILGVLIAFVMVVLAWVLRIVVSAAISYVVVSLFGVLANLVNVDIYSAYDKGIIVTVVTIILVVYSMFNSKRN